jgi:hypothetical protein
MRKFNVRWWVVDPLERYNNSVDLYGGNEGIRLRYIRNASMQDVLSWMSNDYIPSPIIH